MEKAANYTLIRRNTVHLCRLVSKRRWSFGHRRCVQCRCGTQNILCTLTLIEKQLFPSVSGNLLTSSEQEVKTSQKQIYHSRNKNHQKKC